MKILAVDDEDTNLEILVEILTDEGFDVITATNGEDALKQLSNNNISVILLDRMLPVMDGMQCLHKIKANDSWNKIPVIMQTVVTESAKVIEGINSGVYYYLTKPYKKNMLLSIVNAAINDRRNIEELTDNVYQNKISFGLIRMAEFEYSSIEQARNLAFTIASAYPDPGRAIVGLTEMLINAVEHGNLGINFELKSKLMTEGTIDKEIERRMLLPENKDKRAVIKFYRDDNKITVNIRDEGEGFCWQDFFKLRPSRATNPNGRGILMAKEISFDKIKYNDVGNEVCCTVNI